MMENGASGYLLKNATQDELMEAVEAVSKGKTYFSFDSALSMRKPETQTNDVIITRREKEVLDLIANGMTNTEIAGKLFISTTTVDTHRKNLLSKLNAKNTAELIKKAIQHKMIQME